MLRKEIPDNIYFCALLRFTCTRGFQEMISEITDMAGQHEWIAENLTNSTMKSLHLLIQQIKNDKRKVFWYSVIAKFDYC